MNMVNSPAKKTLLIVLGWFLILGTFSLAAANRFNLERDTAYEWISEQEMGRKLTWNPMEYMRHWDSLWYEGIAKDGYEFDPSWSTLSSVVFFPLLPLLMFLLGAVLQTSPFAAGLIVSALSLWGASYFLYRLAEKMGSTRPEIPVLLMLVFPTSIFLSGVYSEPLFMFLSIASFYYASDRKFLRAGIIGGLAALTRINGVVLFFPVFIMYMQSVGYKLDRNLWKPLLIPLGTAIYFSYLYFAFGDFFLYFSAEKIWGRTIGAVNFMPSLATHPAVVNFGMDLLFTVTAIVLTFFVWKRLGLPYGLYMALSLVVILAAGSLAGIGRYVMVLFPMYLLISEIKSEYARYAWIFSSILLFALYTILFVNEYWAG